MAGGMLANPVEDANTVFNLASKRVLTISFISAFDAIRIHIACHIQSRGCLPDIINSPTSLACEWSFMPASNSTSGSAGFSYT